MLTDYKFAYVSERSGSLEVLVRFYEGDYTKDRFDADGNLLPGKAYERYALLREEWFRLPRMAEAALLGLMRAELAKDRTRTPIEVQRNA